MSGNSKVNETKAQIEEKQSDIIKTLENDGVVNPKGLFVIGAGILFIAGVPLTSYLAQPNGILEKLVNAVCSGIVLVGTAGSSSVVFQNSKIAALSTLYVLMTYGFSGAASSAGIDAAHKEGRDNNHPRAQVSNLRGLPLRLHSAHSHLVEFFPGFALAAALAQAIAPGDQMLVNLLGLHVIMKVFVHWPAYLLNISIARSGAHMIATASVINVVWELAMRSNS